MSQASYSAQDLTTVYRSGVGGSRMKRALFVALCIILWPLCVLADLGAALVGVDCSFTRSLMESIRTP